jgi:hypothetical protein
MKKIIIAAAIVSSISAMLGADIRRNDSPNVTVAAPKKKCIGYTIIEFGKGIDCNGDTVKLKRIHGVQVLAAN